MTLLLSLLLACSPGGASIKLTADTASGDDTAASDTAWDTAAETGNGGDTTPPEEEDPSGTYRGSTTGEITMEGRDGRPDRTDACSGDATFTIDSRGGLTGEASCVTREGFGAAGTLSGNVASGGVNARWTIEAGRGTADVPLTGSVAAGTLALSGSASFGPTTVTVRLQGTR